MNNIFSIIRLISENKFETLLLACIIFLIGLACYQYFFGKHGTWSKTFFYPFLNNNIKDHDLKPQSSPKRDSSGEIECRRVLQKLFRRSFDKIRPDFLNNIVTGGKHNLEIDCYNHELKLGIEYQGKQHYEFVSFFHKNYEAFMNQKYRDELKRMLLKQNGVTLIEVPYTIKNHQIESYLIQELNKHGFLKNV